MVAEADQALAMAGGPQAGFRVVAPLLPQSQGGEHLVVGAGDPPVGGHRQLDRSRGHGPGRQAVLQGVITLPATAHNPHLLGIPFDQAARHGGAVGQTGGEQQRHLPHGRQGTGAVGGAHEDAFAPHQLRRHRQRGIAKVVTVHPLAAALTGPQPLLGWPGGGSGLQLSEVSEGLDRLGTVLQRPGDGGGGAEHVDHHGRIRSALGGGQHRGHRLGGMEVRDVHRAETT